MGQAQRKAQMVKKSISNNEPGYNNKSLSKDELLKIL